MSRFIGFGFLAIDATASISTWLSCSSVLASLVVSGASSLMIAMMSKTVRSLLWPTYFWD